jgi:hypothetical protein
MTRESPGPHPRSRGLRLGCVLLWISSLSSAGCDILGSDLSEVPVVRIRHGGAIQDRHYAAPFQDVKEALLGSLRGLAFTIESSEFREGKGLQAFVVAAHRGDVTRGSMVMKANVTGDVLVSVELTPPMKELAAEIHEELARRLPGPGSAHPVPSPPLP